MNRVRPHLIPIIDDPWTRRGIPTAISQVYNKLLSCAFEPSRYGEWLARFTAEHETLMSIGARPEPKTDETWLPLESLIASRLSPEVSKWQLILESPGSTIWNKAIPNSAVGLAADMIAGLYWSEDPDEIIAGLELPSELAERLEQSMRQVGELKLPNTKQGVWRLPHASLFIFDDTSSIVLDPIPFSDLPGIEHWPLRGVLPEAILITHTHGDHWDLGSTLHYVDSDAQVIVPKVPSRSILAGQDPKWELVQTEREVRALEWGESVHIGNFRITALPFYGEQPTVEEPGAPHPIRNWGNTYLIEHEDFAVLSLVDSGRDPLGNVADVIEQKLAEIKTPVLVTSCLRTFACPFFGGLEDYWVPLTMGRLRELWKDYERGQLQSVTAGPRAMAEALRRCKNVFFAPYAHGWHGVFGRPIPDIGWGSGDEPSEPQVLRELTDYLGSTKRVTVIDWNVGDCLTPTPSGFSNLPFGM